MGRPNSVSTTTEERKRRKRELERKRYQKIKGNSVLYAQYQLKNKAKYEKRKAQKKVISIKDMTPRARKAQRKKWREAFNAYYKRKKDAKADAVRFMESYSPPDSEAEENNELQRTTETNVANRNSPSPSILDSPSILYISKGNKENTNPNSRITRSQNSPLSDCRSHSQVSETSSVSSRAISPSRLIRKLRYKKDKEIKVLTKQLEGIKKLNEAYRKKIKTLTEEKKENSMDIMNDNLLHSYTALKTHKAKQEFSRNLRVNIKTTLKDKGRLGKLTNIFRRRVSEQKGSKVKKIRQDIKKFLEEDENSSVTAGKKETVKKAGVIKQIRYMTDSLYHLHRKFLTKVDYKLSFSTFSRFRPFWIRFSSQKPKETCLCITHENFGLLVEAMHKYHIIPHKNATDVLIDICCDPFSSQCLLRICKDCKPKNISNYQEFDNSDDFSYWSWASKLEQIVQNGQEKIIRVVKKEKIVTRPRDAIHVFEKHLENFSKHCGRVTAQHNAIKTLKDYLQPEEAIIHVDFSENYKCQYAKEIQAVHFGGSRKQVTLHTSLLYFYNSDYTRTTQCFATISQNLRHDAVAVWAHLDPILEYLEQKAPQITTLHFVSDSATSQYRNYKTFFVIGALKWQYPRLVSLTWNYTESGHGKGAPDGVGGTLKRTADAIVARGHDIPDFDAFVEALKTNTKNIKIEIVSDYDIIAKDILLPTDLRAFKGTQQVHQVIWNDSDKYQMTMRNLSCVEKACIIRPRCCSHVKYLGTHVLRSEILSNPSIPDHEIENPNLSNITSPVVALKRSYAFCAMSEADLPEELRSEIAIASACDVRSECTDLNLSEEIVLHNLTSMDSFNLPEANKEIDISRDVEVLDVPLQTVIRSALEEPLIQQHSSDLTGLVITANSPVTKKSAHDVPLFQLSSSDMAVSLTSVRRPGVDSSMPAENSVTCLKSSCLSIVKPSTSKYVSPDIIHSHLRAELSKTNSKGRKKGKILIHKLKTNKKMKETREIIERKRNKSASIVQKYSQGTSRRKPKTKNRRKTREEISSDEEMTLGPLPESDLYNRKDETIEKSELEENDDGIDADEDNVHEGDWVVVKFISQKNVVHRYVGQVVNESLASLDVKFAKKINERKFKWPEKTDISVIGKYQVIKKLPPPYFKPSYKRIGAFEFPKSLRQLKIDIS
ncbi:hypothetical protein K1T71_006374 [Dendrolimus kikuchii]|uniref:Uncharacterized protein n=1 Tax=Dendrolimus kikuchii TaxID=765133 RepID=A0ACC1D404_9NEOP|nr:hypothetical protein K1T71_006374 [Dendrolimus kikuchii]